MTHRFHNLLGPHASTLIGAYVSRVERLDEEIGEKNKAKAQVFREVKDMGLDPRILRLLLRRRRRNKEEVSEEDYLIDLYEEALQQFEKEHGSLSR